MLNRRARVDAHRADDATAARAAALAMLGRREYATGELSAALARKGYAAEAARVAVAELAGEGLVDDARYASSLVRMLSARGQGPSRIKQELGAAGVGASQTESALAEISDWSSLAAEVRRRKFGAGIPADWPSRAKQMRFLQYRGFGREQIAAVLDGAGDDDETA